MDQKKTNPNTGLRALIDELYAKISHAVTSGPEILSTSLSSDQSTHAISFTDLLTIRVSKTGNYLVVATFAASIVTGSALEEIDFAISTDGVTPLAGSEMFVDSIAPTLRGQSGSVSKKLALTAGQTVHLGWQTINGATVQIRAESYPQGEHATLSLIPSS